MTLTSVGEPDDAKGKTISEIGSMLFTRGVSGTRVVTGRDTKVIEGYTFKGKSIIENVVDELLMTFILHQLGAPTGTRQTLLT